MQESIDIIEPTEATQLDKQDTPISHPSIAQDNRNGTDDDKASPCNSVLPLQKDGAWKMWFVYRLVGNRWHSLDWILERLLMQYRLKVALVILRQEVQELDDSCTLVETTV